jgi:phosphoribosylglycinamide formyltransferase-1
MTLPLRVAVLLSGNGLTLQNLHDRAVNGQLPIEIVLVISNKPDAFGLERAKKMNVPACAITRKEAGSLEAFSQRIFDQCRDAKVDLVVLAGFMTLVQVPDDFLGRVMNIHPALIPAFCGKGMYGHHVHEAVIESGVKLTGCTVHFADNQYDHGPIILQRAVPVLDDDTPQTLAARVFAEECIAYPEAIRLFAEKRLRIEGKRVRVKEPRTK